MYEVSARPRKAELRRRRGPVVQAEHPLDDAGERGRHVQRAGAHPEPARGQILHPELGRERPGQVRQGPRQHDGPLPGVRADDREVMRVREPLDRGNVLRRCAELTLELLDAHLPRAALAPGADGGP